MGLLDFAKIRYTDSQATNTASQQVGMNPFATTGINPFLPAASAYPMGTSLFASPNFEIPTFNILPQFDYSSVSSIPSLFNFTPLYSQQTNSTTNSGNKKQQQVSLSSGNLGKDIVATAKQYIGYNEKDGSYKLFTNGRKEAWCADFATYVTKQALRANGKTVPSGFGSSSVAGLKSWGQKNGRYTTDISQAKPGDIVIFNKSHTGIVKNILADGTVVTIEGNTSDKVAERKYSPNSGKINGFVQVA